MYSWEIEELLKLREYILEVKEYMKICSESPQIDHVKYEEEPNGYNYNLYTNDGYSWKIKVYCKRSDER